jgi:hypothetical protein
MATESTEIVRHAGHEVALATPREQMRDTLQTLQVLREFIRDEFKKDIDFGPIPGTGKKDVLFLAGAQKTVMYFNCFADPRERETELGDGHLEVVNRVELISRATGKVVGAGIGSCSTREEKYAYRNASRSCPACGEEAIIPSKFDGGGWYCFPKKGGCGQKYKPGHPGIDGQIVGKVPTANIWDARNTVRKMSFKRAMVSAAIGLACMSELFTQDIEEVYGLEDPDEGHSGEPETSREPKPNQAPPADPKPVPRQQAPTATPTRGDLPSSKREIDEAFSKPAQAQNAPVDPTDPAWLPQDPDGAQEPSDEPILPETWEEWEQTKVGGFNRWVDSAFRKARKEVPEKTRLNGHRFRMAVARLAERDDITDTIDEGDHTAEWAREICGKLLKINPVFVFNATAAYLAEKHDEIVGAHGVQPHSMFRKCA